MTVKAVKIRIIILAAFTVLFSAVCLEGFLRHDGIVASFIRATAFSVEQQHIFGIFHLVSLALCVSLAVAIVLVAKKIPDASLDGIVFSVGLLLFSLEIYKQLYYHIAIGNGHYNFAILPLQLCSYALYLYLCVPLLPEGRLKSALYSFCGLFLTLGACIVMGYPTLYADAALNIHTMLWHTLMVLTGMLILKKRGLGSSFIREMAGAVSVFLATLIIATAINLTLTPYIGDSLGRLNLFYMNPSEKTHYLIIKDVWAAFGWFPALISYALLFICVGAPLVWCIARLLNIFAIRKGKKLP